MLRKHVNVALIALAMHHDRQPTLLTQVIDTGTETGDRRKPVDYVREQEVDLG
jgi:hypothetical protein